MKSTGKAFHFFCVLVTCLLFYSCGSSRSRKRDKAPDNAALFSPSTSLDKKPDEMPPRTLSFLWPIEGKPRIASFFGWRQKGGRRAGERMHEGIDIGGSLGQNIYASAEGRVIDVAFVRGYGRTVLLYHGAGWTTLYAHLSKYKVKKSQDLNAGDLVGLMGRSGRAQAVHLHFEIRKGADPLDPLLFLPSRELEKYAPHDFFNEDEGQ